MPENPYSTLALIPGTYDWFGNGQLHTNCQSRMVFILSEANLADLPDYEPGTFAATFGMAEVYQKTPSGLWIEVG